MIRIAAMLSGEDLPAVSVGKLTKMNFSQKILRPRQ